MDTDDEDEDIESETEEDRAFLDDEEIEEQGVSFYRALDRERQCPSNALFSSFVMLIVAGKLQVFNWGASDWNTVSCLWLIDSDCEYPFLWRRVFLKQELCLEW